MDEGIAVLIAPYQKSIDEIIEGYLFKDLHDFNDGVEQDEMMD